MTPEEAARLNRAYQDQRIAFMIENGFHGPLLGYGGRGTSVVSQHKLAVTNPKHFMGQTVE